LRDGSPACLLGFVKAPDGSRVTWCSIPTTTGDGLLEDVSFSHQSI
jgi:hypothetical protein